MSERDNKASDAPREESRESISNPFAVGDEAQGEKTQINLSPRRAAVLGLWFGLVMVGLLLICFLGSAALASCSG